jgi:hypothetical protein
VIGDGCWVMGDGCWVMDVGCGNLEKTKIWNNKKINGKKAIASF